MVTTTKNAVKECVVIVLYQLGVLKLSSNSPVADGVCKNVREVSLHFHELDHVA